MYYEFDIGTRFPSFNEYICACRSNPFAGAKMKTNNEEIAGFYIMSAKAHGYLPKNPIDKPVIVHFTYYEPNAKRDVDNISGFAHKIILDELVKTKVLHNDNQKWVKGLRDIFFIKKSPTPKITVQIEEC